MPSTDSPAILCARFLKSNNYEDTLRVFLAEAGLAPDVGSLHPGDLTIEKLLEEKRLFDLSLNFEKLGAAGDSRGWCLPAPAIPHVVKTLPSASNLLHVSVETFSDDVVQGRRQMILATTADRQLNLVHPGPDFALSQSLEHVQDSPILSCAILGTTRMITITTSMSGQVVIYDHRANRVLDSRRDHQKFVVKVATVRDHQKQSTWVATAGWDAKIFLYRMRGDVDHGTCFLGDPVASMTLSTNPENITFLEHPSTQEWILLVTRKDSTFLHYYMIEEKENIPEQIIELKLIGRQNLTPNSNSWISFSPSAMALCPTDRSILAVATSTVPHMKLILVKMLLPPLRSVPAQIDEHAPEESQIRDKLASEGVENEAIRLHVSTFAPQTPYSTPQICWRPDGSGLWVNGDDGVLRGVEAKSGKVVSTLKGGHEFGFKIRSLWAGMVAVDGQEEEWVVSGGFDKRLIVWKPGIESKREG